MLSLRLGIAALQGISNSGVPIDPDAEAFFTAAGITDPTQQTAVNQLVLDLKGYNIWTKMTALYPIVGGSASSHAVNLKTPGTYNLTFSTGWTHSSTGMTPTSAYANTFLNTSIIGLNSGHYSFYSRTNNTTQSADIGNALNSPQSYSYLYTYIAGALRDYRYADGASLARASGITSTNGMFITSRTASNIIKGYRNGSVEINSNAGSNSTSTVNFYLGCYNNNGTPEAYSNRQNAFASIGTGLTDTEAANFYTAVQAYQTTLGRSVGTQTVSDPDAQAFVTAASIQDQVQATAVNNLVIGLKADSLWTKMKAIYPIVGGTASSHAVNLKTPGTYNLTFATGVTHSPTGMVSNGSTGYADTFLNPLSVLSLNSSHISYYSRTNAAENVYDMGAGTDPDAYLALNSRNTLDTSRALVNDGTIDTVSNTDSRGFFIANRTASNIKNFFKNNSKTINVSTASGNLVNLNLALMALRTGVSSVSLFNTKQCAFASIGDGLTDAEANNLNTRVQNFQTTLNRQV